MPYTVGDVVITDVTFRKQDTKELIDPTGWSIEVQPPNGQASRTLVYGVDAELQLVSSPGKYEYRQTTSAGSNDDAGRWQCFLISTGTGQASRPFHFVVGQRPINL